MAESEEELKSLDKVKEESKSCLKLSIQKTKIMAAGPITSWQADEKTMETEVRILLSTLRPLGFEIIVRQKNISPLLKLLSRNLSSRDQLPPSSSTMVPSPCSFTPREEQPPTVANSWFQ